MKRLAFLTLLLIPGPLAAADSADTAITWFRTDFPPVHISEGPYQALEMLGPIDRAIVRALEQHGYTITTHRGTWERIEHELHSGKRACTSVLLLSPERVATLEYSIAHSLALPPGVVIRKSDLGRFQRFATAAGRVSLDALLRESELKLGITAGRLYTGIMDTLLNAHLGETHIFPRYSQDGASGLVRMLLSGRVDYTLLFPWEAMYLARLEGKPQEVATFAVDGMADYVLSASACPKTAWGQQVIAIANTAIRAVRTTPEYTLVKEYWLDEAARVLYRKYLTEYLGRDPRN
jgi:uncharacterized protein (TIGR02285 family)